MFYLLILILIIDNIRKWHSWIKNNDNSWLKTMLARRLFSNVSLTVLIIFQGYHIITTRLIPKSENTQTVNLKEPFWSKGLRSLSAFYSEFLFYFFEEFVLIPRYLSWWAAALSSSGVSAIRYTKILFYKEN